VAKIALWMVVLNAFRCNPWLRQHYERLRAAGKPGKGSRGRGDAQAARRVWSVATHRKPFVPHLPEVPARLGVLTNKA
jgi:transposase